MRLGVHYHVPIHKAGGKYFTPSYFGLFLNALKSKVDYLTVFYFSPLPEEIKFCDTLVENEIELVNIGSRRNIVVRTIVTAFYLPSILSRKDIAAIILRMPTPLFLFYWIIRLRHKVIPYSVGDYSEVTLASTGFRKILYKLIQFGYKANWSLLAKSDLVMCNSEKLLNQFNLEKRNCFLVKSSTLSEKYFPSLNIASDKKANLVTFLYAGRLSPEKGIQNAISAIKNLNSSGLNIHFTIAGFTMGGDEGYEKELKEQVRELGMVDKITFLGFLRAGDELNKAYEAADYFILPSISEGFPRVIWEAMAFGLPVLASKVGSIPFYLKDKENCIFLEPDSVNSIEMAVRNLLSDNHLVLRLRKNGYLLAKENTVEKSAERMISAISKFLHVA